MDCPKCGKDIDDAVTEVNDAGEWEEEYGVDEYYDVASFSCPHCGIELEYRIKYVYDDEEVVIR